MTAFRNISMDDLLPQQPPFRFVDALEHYDEEKTCVSFTPVAGGMLVQEDGCLSAAGLIEHMAQACAVRNGYVSKYILHRPVSLGYIGQVRNYEIIRLPRVGERMETTVWFREELFSILLTDVEVFCGGALVARATLKTANKND